MEQVVDFGFKVHGCGGDDLFDGHKLAIEAWGPDRAKDKNGGLLAMAYLWRRFGPPWRGGDSHKSLVDYVLTTKDPQVFLWLHLNACGLAASVGYYVHKSIRDEANRPVDEWVRNYDTWWWTRHPEFASWDDTKDNRQEVSEIYWREYEDKAVQAAARAAIGSFPPRPREDEWRTETGVVHRVNQAVFDALKELERPVYVRDCAINVFGRSADTDQPAEQSRYGGYGVPKEAMDEYFKETPT